MTDAREIIAMELARISRIDMSEAPPYARASIHTAALHINRALHDAGFRILGPDEVDPVTVERAAEVACRHVHEPGLSDNPSYVRFEPADFMAKKIASAIRALTAKD